MIQPKFIAMPTKMARNFQNGGLDPNGQVPEVAVSDGDGNPCRHCLQDVAAGEPYLILAYRPFPGPQPYAEIGPIFLHADECERYTSENELPPIFQVTERLLIRGYGVNDRIVYGTGHVVSTAVLQKEIAALLEIPAVQYVHIRSASNNCYQARAEPA